MRTAKIILHIGAKKTGKTFETLNIIRDFVLKQRRPVIIFSPLQKEYEIFPRVEIEALENFRQIVKQQIVRITDLNRWAEAVDIINGSVRNAMIVFEDSTRYIDNNPPAALKDLIYNNRNIGVDLVFTFHTLAAIPNELMKNVDIMILRKTLDNLRSPTVRQKIAIHETVILEAVSEVEKSNSLLDKKHPENDPLHGIHYSAKTLVF